MVLAHITKKLPRNNVDIDSFDTDDMVLADPGFKKSGEIDILIGSDYYHNILVDGVVKNASDSLIAQRTKLGWIVSGITIGKNLSLNKLHVQSHMANVDLERQLKLFWNTEEIPQNSTQALSQEEDECENLYQTTTRRDSNGRYIVKLPFKQFELGSSRKMAVATLLHMEKKFAQNPKLREGYVAFMKEYEKLGQMSRVKFNDDPKSSNYLPHHAVMKEDSTTTKLRVVFDGKRKTGNGMSLNQILKVGPKLQDNLFCILLRWRRHRVAMAADIEKMYRQILVDQKDAEFQRIVWRESPYQPILDYRLETVTYGTSCAPYLAIKTLQQLAKDEMSNYPTAAKISLRDFYVDDLLTGADTVETAIKIQEDITKLMNAGGLCLRKWTSNEPQVLQAILPKNRGMNIPIDIGTDEIIKALGVYWNPIKDRFGFKVKLDLTDDIPTKRQLLSDISKLFDPLGCLAPVIVRSKILMQTAHQSKIGWDDKIPQEMANEWNVYKHTLEQLEQLSIPRWIGTVTSEKIELHGFSDASEKAYAAVIYARTIHSNGMITVRLLTAKTRVAPINDKKQTIPRLELLGAHVLSTLMKTITNTMEFDGFDEYLYTDSTAVLGWIQGQPSQWKPFVSNKVAAIQDMTNKNQWHHITGGENPADCASRGILADELVSNQLWWNGPTWLLSKNINLKKVSKFETELEMRRNQITSCVTMVNPDDNIIQRYSNLKRLRTVTALLFRFCHNCRQSNKKYGPVDAKELTKVEMVLIRLEQQTHFPEEWRKLNKKNVVHRTSKLLTLNPFMDDKGIIRVGGRLENAPMAFCQPKDI